MKKLFILLALTGMVQLASAQESFHKHALIVSVGVGDDIYGITEKYYINGIPGIYHTVTGTAACATYPFSVEYAVGRWLGLGIVGKVDNYFIKKDSASGYQPTAFGFEFGALVNFHLVRTHHIDFFLGLNLGGSSFTYTMDQQNDQVYGTGSWADFHASLRYYFGRFGIYGSLSFPKMTYNLTGNNANWSLGQNILSTWEAQGGAFSIGLQYRFFNPPGDK